MSRKTKRRMNSGSYCKYCSKMVWQTWEQAKLEVERLKASADARRPYLLDAYRCPVNHRWRIGHNYKLQWLSL